MPTTRPENWQVEAPGVKAARVAKIRQVINVATKAAGHVNEISQWKKFVEKVPTRPPDKSVNGVGVVIAGGGPVYFSSAWVIVRQLRALGCNFPVEIWVTAGEVVDPIVRGMMEQEGIEIEDATELLPTQSDGTGQAERVASGM